MATNSRLQHEIEHGQFLAEQGAGEIWNWETPAGKLRWERRVKMLASHITPKMKVLEIGCGTGYLTQELAKSEAHIIAIDISPHLLCIARRDIQAPNIQFLLENAYQLSFPDQVFDSVIGSSVLHHVNIDLALEECYRVLKPGGTIYFTEPNILNPQIAVQKNIPYLKKRLGDSPDETAFFKWTLSRKLQHQGFTHVIIQAFDFLHPQIPKKLVPWCVPLCQMLEHIPGISEIAGSLYIRARR
ncbi:methyltransferase domain-containing protein [candidate division KSB3 bacterium]|uniref:Methyltransferase domain-containing protein n=1 Tax=candidate division KSB3 bacterium TaxID=2044937 RepID=A0A9D5K033_9BACT|nr:methyltransferase domain-containing protein [candidate division KSB3 bacterium]MBD3327126.1 methyltransferase domain-containing protein [candidate division KSB3 bacterium]